MQVKWSTSFSDPSL